MAEKPPAANVRPVLVAASGVIAALGLEQLNAPAWLLFLTAGLALILAFTLDWLLRTRGRQIVLAVVGFAYIVVSGWFVRGSLVPKSQPTQAHMAVSSPIPTTRPPTTAPSPSTSPTIGPSPRVRTRAQSQKASPDDDLARRIRLRNVFALSGMSGELVLDNACRNSGEADPMARAMEWSKRVASTLQHDMRSDLGEAYATYYLRFSNPVGVPIPSVDLPSEAHLNCWEWMYVRLYRLDQFSRELTQQGLLGARWVERYLPAAADEDSAKGRKALDALAALIAEGTPLLEACQGTRSVGSFEMTDNTAMPKAIEWSRRASEALALHLGESYAKRFTNPAGISIPQAGPKFPLQQRCLDWMYVRLARLEQFSQELSRKP